MVASDSRIASQPQELPHIQGRAAKCTEPAHCGIQGV
eukprot:CAMPEP_0176082212 /NCGR_PEP_ID=MMETSP0120_2-20121206/41123_1 /TAXON_ID=160619 /ORGANISM="Kryptoperidinium foliaceum, Strain CCMP 1326" /LENGTH=36 /DNA_ID= /DNA_START= /DNA_END= /DNA_ORIENTATION=